jgi:hypothetical protein
MMFASPTFRFTPVSSDNSTFTAGQVKCQLTPVGAKSSWAWPSIVIFGSEVMTVVPNP